MNTILLVEDEFLLALAGEDRLKRHGYEVLLASNGQAAIDAIRTMPHISLVLMDIDLGDGSTGIEAAQTILTMKRLPILFLTSRTDPDAINAARSVTHYGYLLKQSGEFVVIEAIRMAYALFEAHQRLAELEASDERRRGAQNDAEMGRGIDTMTDI